MAITKGQLADVLARALEPQKILDGVASISTQWHSLANEAHSGQLTTEQLLRNVGKRWGFEQSLALLFGISQSEVHREFMAGRL